MSLLMDALRKAEEAKKKAALENKSEDASPAAAASQQSVAAGKKTSGDSAAPKIELSMEAMEDLPKRSAVPITDTTLEFEDDEEDYVLPTSIGRPADSAAKSDSDSGVGAEIKAPAPEAESIKKPAGAPEIDLGNPIPEPASTAAAVVKRPLDSGVERNPLQLDDFEDEDETASGGETKAVTSAVVPQARSTEQPAKPLGAPVRVRVAEQARERVRSRDVPERLAARNVFAAKKSALLNDQNIKVAVGGVLALCIVIFGTYFYFSLTAESTFNIPPGSYVATEFVDDGAPLGEEGQLLASDALETDDLEEIPESDLGDAISPELAVASASVNLENIDTPFAATSASTAIEPSVPELAVLSEPNNTAADLQPEVLREEPPRLENPRPVTPRLETPQLETIVTTIGAAPVADTPVVEATQPAVSGDFESTDSEEATNLISFRRQETMELMDPNLSGAFAAYQRGELDQAEALYRQVLARAPLQRDALLGLASIAAGRGNSTEALDLYSRLLARNPNDPIARAGLLELLPAGSSEVQEAELKRLLNEHPNIAALSYAYGNFLASNQRWPAAQQAYFRALQLAKTDSASGGLVNPDYAFNLAVSLEHLNQSEPAQNYYREALSLAANHPASFDLAAVRSRLASMSGTSNNE